MKIRFLGVILIIALSFAFTGCGSKNLTEDEACNLIVSEVETILGTDTEGSNALSEAIRDGLKVEVSGLDKNGSEYVAHCTISNHDLAKAVAVFADDEKTADPEAFKSEMAEAFLKADLISEDCDVTISLNDGAYEAQLTEEQFDIASGGLVSLMKEWGEQ